MGNSPTKCFPLEADLDFATAFETTLCAMVVVTAVGFALMVVELFREAPLVVSEEEREELAIW